MKKNVSSQVIGVQMISAEDGSAFTGSVTVYVCGDGGTQAVGSVGSGACTHEGNGYHTYAPAQAETNYDLIAFTFTGTGAIPVTVQVFTGFPLNSEDSGATAVARTGADADTLETLSDQIDATATQASVDDVPTATEIKTALEAAGSHLTLILEDTGTTLDGKVDTIAAYLDTEVAAILAAVDTEISTAITEIGKIPKSDGVVSWNATALGAIKTALEAAGSHLALIKAKTDNLSFTGTDVNATLDGEEVTPTAASKTGYQLTAAYDPAKTSAQAGDIPSGDITAIKAKTDKMTYTSGNDLDVNIQKINDVEIEGDGTLGNEWGAPYWLTVGRLILGKLIVGKSILGRKL